MTTVRSRDAGARAYVWTLGSSAKPVAIDLSRWTRSWPSAALSPDGRLLYTATPTVRVHDLRSGRVRTLFAQGATEVWEALEISPDGRQLVLAQGLLGNDALLLDAETGQVRHTLSHEVPAWDARFSSDGRRVLVVTSDNGVSVWDTSTGTRLTRFAIPEGNIPVVDLVGAGEQVVSATADQGVRHWDVDGRRGYLRRVPVDGMPWPIGGGGSCIVTPSADGAYVFYGMCNKGMSGFVLDVSRRRAYPEQTSGDPGNSWGGSSWSSTADEYLRANSGTFYAWDGRTGRVRSGPHPVGDHVNEVDHSPDGSRVVVAELSGTLTLLDGSTLEPVGRPADAGGNVCCVALGPDNRTAFALVAQSIARYQRLLAQPFRPVGPGGPRGG